MINRALSQQREKHMKKEQRVHIDGTETELVEDGNAPLAVSDRMNKNQHGGEMHTEAALQREHLSARSESLDINHIDNTDMSRGEVLFHDDSYIPGSDACMFLQVSTYTHSDIHTYIHIYTYIYIHLSIQIYIHIYAYIFTDTPQTLVYLYM